MNFTTEAESVERLKETLRESYRTRPVRIFEEVNLGNGIADIVASDFVKPSNNQTQIRLDYFEINVYLIIYRQREATIQDIVEITRSSKVQVIKSLENLMKSNYIIENNSKYLINKTYQLPFKATYAIEAKLKNWKRALNQAYRYKWFANYTFVVLDADYSKSAMNNIDVFKKFNVGLATINKEGTLLRHYFPHHQEPIDIRMQILFAENYALAR